jgi:hypothetical protein
MAATLASHSQQLNDMRHEFLTGFRTVAQELGRIVDGLQTAARSQQDAFTQQVADLWQKVEEAINRLNESQQAQSQETTALLSSAVRDWKQDLSLATEAMLGQLRELERHGETLKALSGEERQLIQLQATLQDNLQSVRAVETFEETIHSLSAAVHLLTARANSARAA